MTWSFTKSVDMINPRGSTDFILGRGDVVISTDDIQKIIKHLAYITDVLEEHYLDAEGILIDIYDVPTYDIIQGHPVYPEDFPRKVYVTEHYVRVFGGFEELPPALREFFKDIEVAIPESMVVTFFEYLPKGSREHFSGERNLELYTIDFADHSSVEFRSPERVRMVLDTLLEVKKFLPDSIVHVYDGSHIDVIIPGDKRLSVGGVTIDEVLKRHALALEILDKFPDVAEVYWPYDSTEPTIEFVRGNISVAVLGPDIDNVSEYFNVAKKIRDTSGANEIIYEKREEGIVITGDFDNGVVTVYNDGLGRVDVGYYIEDILKRDLCYDLIRFATEISQVAGHVLSKELRAAQVVAEYIESYF